MNAQELEYKYGTVEYLGKKYILTDQAECTSRLLSDNLNDHFEMSASAIDEDENEYAVYWVFENKFDGDGDPAELDDYDYDDVDRVVAY